LNTTCWPTRGAAGVIVNAAVPFRAGCADLQRYRRHCAVAPALSVTVR
jgi:hypothetical protein